MALEDKQPDCAFKNEYHKLRANILYTANWLTNGVRAILEPYGITHKQYNILQILRDVHPDALAILDVQQRMIDKMSDTSRLIDRLVKKGWVNKVRCPQDRRSAKVQLNEEGRALLCQIDRRICDMDNLFCTLSPTEAAQLNTLLRRARGECAPQPTEPSHSCE